MGSLANDLLNVDSAWIFAAFHDGKAWLEKVDLEQRFKAALQSHPDSRLNTIGTAAEK